MAQDSYERVAAIVRDAGGRVVGRTKLQKIAFILEEAGLGAGFSFDYYHYGPFSEELATATRDAVLSGVMSEKEQSASWGGSYSTYEIDMQGKEAADGVRSKIAHAGARANSVELELAATALYLAKQGFPDPWDETSRRKPEKSGGGRIDRAKILYQQVRSFETPVALPTI